MLPAEMIVPRATKVTPQTSTSMHVPLNVVLLHVDGLPATRPKYSKTGHSFAGQLNGASGTRLPIGGAGVVGVGALVRLATVCDDELLDDDLLEVDEAVVGTVQLRAPTPLAAPAHMHCAQ